MAYQGIGTGTTPNDNTGDSLLEGAIKINSNFQEIYNALGDGTNITFSETDLDERIQDIIGSAINSGIQTGISVTYDDVNDRIDFSVSGEYIQDEIGSAINAGIQTGITVTYDDANNRINFNNDIAGPYPFTTRGFSIPL
jgi:hypothetical protein